MSDKTKIEPLSDDQIALIRMVHEDARKFHDVEHCDGCHLLANLDALLADRARLEARVQEEQRLVSALAYTSVDGVPMCRGCSMVLAVVRHFGHREHCWVADVFAEHIPAVQPAAADGSQDAQA